jgi:hypothetical protein
MEDKEVAICLHACMPIARREESKNGEKMHLVDELVTTLRIDKDRNISGPPVQRVA